MDGVSNRSPKKICMIKGACWPIEKYYLVQFYGFDRISDFLIKYVSPPSMFSHDNTQHALWSSANTSYNLEEKRSCLISPYC